MFLMDVAPSAVGFSGRCRWLLAVGDKYQICKEGDKKINSTCSWFAQVLASLSLFNRSDKVCATPG